MTGRRTPRWKAWWWRLRRRVHDLRFEYRHWRDLAARFDAVYGDDGQYAQSLSCHTYPVNPEHPERF